MQINYTERRLKIMTKNEIYSNLCAYDKRSTDYIEPEDDEDEKEPRKNCFCDNCFYSRDELALEILKLWQGIRKRDGYIINMKKGE